MDLASYPVASGSNGIHVYAGLDRKYDSDQINEVAKELANGLPRELPALVFSNMKRSPYEGKVLVDWSQNSAANQLETAVGNQTGQGTRVRDRF